MGGKSTLFLAFGGALAVENETASAFVQIADLTCAQLHNDFQLDTEFVEWY